MITTVTASKVRKAMTPTKVPTNTGTGIAALRTGGVSVFAETLEDDLSDSVAFPITGLTSPVDESTFPKIAVTGKLVGAVDSGKVVGIVDTIR